MMIGMNALIDLEYAAGTLSGERSDAQSIFSVQTSAADLFRLESSSLVESTNDEAAACLYIPF